MSAPDTFMDNNVVFGQMGFSTSSGARRGCKYPHYAPFVNDRGLMDRESFDKIAVDLLDENRDKKIFI